MAYSSPDKLQLDPIIFNKQAPCNEYLQNISTVTIFGVRVHNISLQQLLEFTVCSVESGNKTIISNVNIHALNIAYQTPWFRNYLNHSDIVFCDGFGVRLGSKILGEQLDHRFTPPDWIGALINKGVQPGFSYYFLGSKPGVSNTAAEKLISRYPDARILGTHDGFFNKEQGSAENQAVVTAINQLKPDILMVGFGMPLQEQWIKENIALLNVKIVFPVGALFDFISGQVQRPPAWMTDYGMEWLGRFLIEPKRLWRRYLIGNPLFFMRILRQRMRI